MIRRSVAASIACALLAVSCSSGSGDDSATDRRSERRERRTTDPPDEEEAADVATTPSTVAAPTGSVVTEQSVDLAALDADRATFLLLTLEQQEGYLRLLDAEVERALFQASGLEEALGGTAAADEAFAALNAGIVGPIEQLRAQPPDFGGFGSARVGASGGETSFGGLLFAGYLLSALGTGGAVGVTNDGTSGSETKDSITISGDRNGVSVSSTHDFTSNGATAKLSTKTELMVCPDANGDFTGKAQLDMSASAGSAGHNGTLDIEFVGHVDDNAAIAGLDISVRFQAAEFSGGKGGFLDISTGFGTGPNAPPSHATVNRSGGTVTDSLGATAGLLGQLFGAMIAVQLGDQAQKGWESGRCVKLEPTSDPAERDGVEPLAAFSITAAPRSLIDGGPVGGSVTATLTGSSSVEPSGTPVPADAAFTYVAPGEPDSTGGVALEARSRRGVAKASLSFSTGAPYSYQIAGGLDDFQVNQAVCDVLQPFVLDDGQFALSFSGGLSGTYTYTGVLNAGGQGEYVINLPDGPGQPGTMVGGGPGTIAGQSGSGTEHYVLTPISPC